MPQAAAAASHAHTAPGITHTSRPRRTCLCRLQVKWETAPTCASTPPTLVTSMADSEGRLWWWEADQSCAYRHEDGSAFTRQHLLDALAQATGGQRA